jgi:hypothetical protein
MLRTVVPSGNQTMWRAGIDHETYAWMFRLKSAGVADRCPFQTGRAIGGVEAATKAKQGKSIVRNAR